MNHLFSQPKVIFKISFITKHEHLNKFEEFFSEEILGISSSEIESSTIDSKPYDLWQIEILYANKPNIATLSKKLNEYALINDLQLDSELQLELIEDKDWVAEYQKQLKPIVIEQFFIAPKSLEVSIPNNKIPIYIEASRAFGTGEHATTSLCIKAINSLRELPIDSVFDLGTGSGILSFVSEKIWPKAQIYGCDIEETSVNIAKNNRICNNSKINFYQNSESELINSSMNIKFDLIVSNILATPLIILTPKITALIKPSSHVILSGFLDYQLKSVLDAYEKHGLKVVNILIENNWVAVLFSVNNN